MCIPNICGYFLTLKKDHDILRKWWLNFPLLCLVEIWLFIVLYKLEPSFLFFYNWERYWKVIATMSLTFLTVNLPHSYRFFFLWWELLRSILLATFICNMLLLIIVPMLYITSSWLILKLKVCTFWPPSSILPILQPPSHLWQPPMFSVSMSFCKWGHSFAIYLSPSDLFHLR